MVQESSGSASAISDLLVENWADVAAATWLLNLRAWRKASPYLRLLRIHILNAVQKPTASKCWMRSSFDQNPAVLAELCRGARESARLREL